MFIMKKFFFIGIVVAVNLLFLTSLTAQNRTRSATSVSKPVEIGAPQKQFSHGNENSRSVKYITDTRSFKTKKASESTRAFPVGVLSAAAESYFWGWSEWDVTVRQDDTSPAKYWFSTLLPARGDNGVPAQTVEIYATLANGVFTFPIGQSLGTYENPSDGEILSLTLKGISNNNGNLSVINTGNITATLNENTIVFQLGFGSQTSKDFWCGIMLPGAVVAEPGFEPVHAYYREPSGMLYYGFLDNGAGSTPLFLQAAYSPFSTWEWRPKFVRENATYKWEYNEFLGWDTEARAAILGATQTHNGAEFSMDVEREMYMFPKFTGTSSTNTESYIDNCLDYPDSAWCYAGGSSLQFEGGGFAHLTNANLDYGTALWYSTDPDAHPFGTGMNREALISCYEKPATPLYFTGVNIAIGLEYVIPTDAELYLDVHEITYDEEGIPVLGEQLATASANSSNILRGSGIGIIVFSQLAQMDADGFLTEIDGLEVDTDFALVFSGYNVDGAKLTVFSERSSRADGSQYSFYINKDDGLIYENTRNNMYIHLINGVYSYILSSENVINAVNGGGEYTVRLNPYFNFAQINDEELPEWITNVTFEDHFNEPDWYTIAKFTVASLPSDIEGRTADLVFTTTGARTTVTVKQGAVGITANKTQKTNVASTANGFELKYGTEFNKATLYNLSGKAIGTYELPQSGNFTIPAGMLNKGIYMIQFTGKTTETVKVVK
jgi:hypothetical protein